MKPCFIAAILLMACGGASNGQSPGTQNRLAAWPSGQATVAEADAFFETFSDDSALSASLQQRAQNGDAILLVFGASWCPDSRAMVQTLADVEVDGVAIVGVNVGKKDRHDAIRARYEVERIPTLVLTTWNAFQSTGAEIRKLSVEPVSRGEDISADELRAWIATGLNAHDAGTLE